MISFQMAGKAYRSRKGAINWVVRNIDTTFPNGRNTGILAPQGEGKSTFISLAAGNETPSEGRVYRQGRISWPYGSKVNLSNKLSGKQNLRFLTDVYGRNFGRVYEFVEEFCDLGRHLDASLRHYTNEMRSRFSVGALFAMEFDHILVDDSMEGGDTAFRKKCTQYIEDNQDRFTFLMATSNVALVSKYCQHAGVLNEGRLTFYETVEEAVEEFNKVNEVVV
jgi:capsular polysaccharide transport system ATP-binding protein